MRQQLPPMGSRQRMVDEDGWTILTTHCAPHSQWSIRGTTADYSMIADRAGTVGESVLVLSGAG